MRRRLMLPVLLVFACASCYPVYKTRRPDAAVTVLNASRRPIPGARVILIASRNPYGREFARDTVVTDSLGVARFQRRKAWEREVLMIHGAWVYFWNWCVEAPGQRTLDTRRDPVVRFQATSELMLRPGDPVACASGR